MAWVAVPPDVVVAAGDVLVRRAGAVGVICDEVVVDPLASAPAGMAIEIPTETMAAANLDFTGFRNVDEWRVAPGPDGILRIMRVVSSARRRLTGQKGSSLPCRRECSPNNSSRCESA